VRTRDIDEAMAVLADTDSKYGYTVAWLDCLARGAQLGRSVVTSGDFARRSDLPARDRRDPLAFRPKARLNAPDIFPPGLLNRLYTVALANEAWVPEGAAPPGGGDSDDRDLLPPASTASPNWNRVYGPGGFAAVPVRRPVRRGAGLAPRARADKPGPRPVLRDRAQALRAPADEGCLSFPMPGWTLALDFPTRTPGLAGPAGLLDDRWSPQAEGSTWRRIQG